EADADIYLCDEVLAVGDEAFQKKCLEVFRNWKEQGKTIVLVSHNAAQVAQICDRAILLDEGRVISQGDAPKIIAEYHERISA
ncbi:MAG TPA: ABC transporter ATP-binding protein, partial [Candidatus Gracilibacteria bacterium]|nr:ABC transporter ATP-binding protein [Candidatus Gracilibacteria bacterium]